MDKKYAAVDNKNMKSVCVLNYPGSYLSCVYGIKDILEYENRGSEPHFSVSILETEELLASGRFFDYLVLPPRRIGERDPVCDAHGLLTQNIKERAACGCVPVSVCAGAFLLCATGLANGRRVVTHWNLAGRLQSLYPAVNVLRDDILVDEGSFISAGGMTGYQDLCLYLLKKNVSAEAAMLTASVFLINSGDRTQLQYAVRDLEFSADAVLGMAQRLIHAEFSRDLSLADIASRCGVSERTLLRKFREHSEFSPQEYLRHTRFAHARKLLAGSDIPVKAVADECGYRDLASFTRTFGRLMGVSPGEYRNLQRSTGKSS